MTTSVPRSFRRHPSLSMAKVLPTPGAAPRYSRSFPRATVDGLLTLGLLAVRSHTASRGLHVLVRRRRSKHRTDPDRTLMRGSRAAVPHSEPRLYPTPGMV